MEVKLHHAGFVVASISDWEGNMLYEHKLKEVVDPVQQAKLALYSNFSNSYIELIEPLNENSFVYNGLKKSGNHFNHFCYQVSGLPAAEQLALKYKLVKILGPVPALLFDNKMVSFYYTRNRQVVEFLVD